MSEQQAEYKIAYVTPGINKVSSDFILPTAKKIIRDFGKTGIYFLQSPEGYIKIGQSTDVFKRMGTYKTHNPGIRIVGFIYTVQDCLDYNENLLQRLWEPFVLSGEWFAPVRPLVEYISYFDKHGYGMPMELIDPEPATYQELLNYQKLIKEARL